MLRTRKIDTLAALLVASLSLATTTRALAQSAPAPGEPPPGYTPPPPPAGYGPPPGYAPRPPNAPPPPTSALPAGRARSAGAAEVRFEPEEPDLELLSMSGGVPVERVHHWHRGWWGGYAVGYGWAPTYAPICGQRCVTRLAPGPYQLALSKNGGPIVPVYGPAIINGPSLIRASYADHSGVRIAGWVVGVTGLVGGIVMIAASAHEETNCDADGFCHRHETADAPLLVGGIGVLLVSGIVGGILASERDEARISVEPLRLASFGSLRETLTASGAQAQPEGAALSLHF